jgi:hypothetical protein
LKTGNVLIAGGDIPGFDATTAELYDPSARTFRSTAYLKMSLLVSLPELG